MPQDGDAHIGMTHPAQLGGYHFPDPSQPGHAAQVTLRHIGSLTAERQTAFSHHNNTKLRTVLVALPDLISNDVEVVRDLRDEDDVGTQPRRLPGRSSQRDAP